VTKKCALKNPTQREENHLEHVIIAIPLKTEQRHDIGRVKAGNKMRHIIYKITNTVNGKYYIGRHSTTDINDGYMGSGIGIKNAIRKYGRENFIKEILEETTTSVELWKLERKYVNEDVVNDDKSYNMSVGGKHYLQGLSPEQLKKHQSNAGKIGASAYRKKLKQEGKLRNWHSAGGKATARLQKEKGTHPFYTGEASRLGGKSVKGMVELWDPKAIATNKNQKEYKIGDCKKTRVGTDKYNQLIENDWLPISEHKKHKALKIA
jgi:hypothetical protein